MTIRGGPAAVTGNDARETTALPKQGGKGERRMTREPEDGRLFQGNADGKGHPCPIYVDRGFLLPNRGSEVRESSPARESNRPGGAYSF